MTATVLDTHRVVKRLQDAGASEQLAETWTDILRESRELDLSQLVTKADLKVELADLRGELKREIADLRGDLRREIAETRAELIKWMVGVGFAQALTLIGALLAFLRLFPGSGP